MSEGSIKKGKRFANALGNTRGHTINGRAKKDQRRKEAFAREAAWRALPLSEQLNRLPIEGAKKQRARIEAAIAKNKEKQSQAQEKKSKKTKQVAV